MMKKLLPIFILFIAIGCKHPQRETPNTLVGVYDSYIPSKKKQNALRLQYNATLTLGGKLELKNDWSFDLAYPPFTINGTWKVKQDSLYLHATQKEYTKNHDDKPDKEEMDEIIAYGIAEDEIFRIIQSTEIRRLEFLKKEN